MRDESGVMDKISPEEMSAFSGLSRAGDCCMICPELLTHVKKMVETDAAIMKQVRLAREERELRRGKKKKGDSKGKDSGDS